MTDTARRLCDFLDASPTAFHAVDSIAALLDAVGARRLDEREAWALEPGATYYVVRSGTALAAFRPGLEPRARAGFALSGAHTDSPALKARIEKDLSSRGSSRVAVELYGGPIVASWLDRPLSLAGRVVVRGSSGPEQRLVNLARPVGVVPNLAIHLNRDMNKGFEYNAQTHLPVLVAAAGNGAAPPAATATTPSPAATPPSPAPGAAPGQAPEANAPEANAPTPGQGGATAEQQVPWAVAAVARELGVESADILGADLYFVDAQKSLVFGEEEELVSAYRLDDLLGCHAILEAFLETGPARHGQLALFLDNEEVGSRTMQGADSSFVRDLLARICALSGCGSEDFHRALASSFCVSVDVAQAWHPSYAEKFDDLFAPVLNGGPAVKANANFKYATDARSEARFRLLCEEAGVPCQKYQSRADIAPGSTIGAMGSALTGVATVDVGAPLLSMHSARETAGIRDHAAMISVLAAHFRSPPAGGA